MSDKCGCGREATHRGRCSWRRAVKPEVLESLRAKRQQNGRDDSSVSVLLVKLEEVHLACISFASQYADLKRRLRRIKAKELVDADPSLDEAATAVLP